MIGYIKDGVYHKADVPVDKLQPQQSSTWKQHDHNRQRKDFAKEIIQPYDRDGKPNPDYINAYPEGAKEYGMTPDDIQLIKQ